MVLTALPCILFLLLGLVAGRSNLVVDIKDIDLHPIAYGLGTPQPEGAQRYWMNSNTIYIDLKRVPFELDHLWEVNVQSEYTTRSSHNCEYTIGYVTSGDHDDMSTFLKHIVRAGSISSDQVGDRQRSSGSSILFLRGNEWPAADIPREDVDYIFIHIDSCFLSRYVHRSQFNRWNQGSYLMDWGVAPLGGESWQPTASELLTATERWEDDNDYDEVPYSRDSTITQQGFGWWKSDFFFDFEWFLMDPKVEPVLDIWFFNRGDGNANNIEFRMCTNVDFSCTSPADFAPSTDTTEISLDYPAALETFQRFYFDFEAAFEDDTWDEEEVYNNSIIALSTTISGDTSPDSAFPPYAKMWNKAFVGGSPMLVQFGRTVAGQTNGCAIDGKEGSDEGTMYQSSQGIFNAIGCRSSTAKRFIHDIVFSFPDGAEKLVHPYLQLTWYSFDDDVTGGFRITISGNPDVLHSAYFPKANLVHAMPLEFQVSLDVTTLNQHQQVTIRRTGEIMGFLGYAPLYSGYSDLCAPGVNPCVNGAECYVAYDKAVCVCAEHWTGPTCAVDEVECTSLSCYNGGTCVDRVGEPGYNCTCLAGWTGHRCERVTSQCRVEGGTAGSRVCLNGGVCSDLPGQKIECKCPAGWSGLWCETPTSRCSLEPTFCNGGACISDPSVVPYEMRCNCSRVAGMGGERCDVPLVCDPSPCKNGGECTTAMGGSAVRCICPANFYGEFCEDTIAEYMLDCRYFHTDCGGKGQCNLNAAGDFRCDCNPFWNGDFCSDHDVCTPNPCKNLGTCVTDPQVPENQQQAICVCSGNWFGDLCEESLSTYFEDCRFSPNACQHGGECNLVDAPVSAGGPHYMCTGCDKEWTGPFCEIADVCVNNGGCMRGTCVPNADGEAECMCPAEFTGDKCQYKLEDFLQMRFDAYSMDCRFSELACMNGGDCMRRGDGSYGCSCSALWTGDHCEVAKVCEPNPCHNGGSCELWNGGASCTCTGGYVGDMCQWTLDDYFQYDCRLRPCDNGGSCTSDGRCVCDTTRWVGQWCDVPVVCQGKDCNGGECIVIADEAECLCPGHLFGDECQYDVEFGLADCRTNPCMNGGTCAEFGETGSYVCNCLTSNGGGKWTGDRCEISRHCNPNPCNNGGECFEAAGAAACLCAGDWTGATCNVLLSTRLAAVETAFTVKIVSEVQLQLSGTADGDEVQAQLLTVGSDLTRLQGTVDAIGQQLDAQAADAADTTATIAAIYDNYARKDETQSIHDLLEELLSPASSVVVSFFTVLAFMFAYLF